MVCLGDMFNYKQSVREKNSLLFFVYLTAEEDKRLRLPEKEVRISFEEAYFVFRKERVNSRETNDMGQTERRTTGYQDVGVFLTGVKIGEVL